MTGQKNKKGTMKKSEFASLDDCATPSLIRRMVAGGIIPPRLFISALIIARNNSFLRKYGVAILALTGLLYIFCSLSLLLVYEWDNIPFLLKPMMTLFLLTCSCIWAYRKGTDTKSGQTAIFSSCIFAGVLLYFGLNNPISDTFGWITLSLWLLLITPWVLLVKKDSLILLWISVFTIGMVMCGIEYILPWKILNWSEFFSLAAVCSFVLLGLREVYVFGHKGVCGNMTRLMPLFYGLALALTPIILSAFDFQGGSLSLSALVFILLFMIGFGLYYALLRDLQALTLVIFFFCAFCVFLAYLNYSRYDHLISSFAFIVFPFGFFSWFMFSLRSNKNGDKL